LARRAVDGERSRAAGPRQDDLSRGHALRDRDRRPVEQTRLTARSSGRIGSGGLTEANIVRTVAAGVRVDRLIGRAGPRRADAAGRAAGHAGAEPPGSGRGPGKRERVTESLVGDLVLDLDRKGLQDVEIALAFGAVRRLAVEVDRLGRRAPRNAE